MYVAFKQWRMWNALIGSGAIRQNRPTTGSHVAASEDQTALDTDVPIAEARIPEGGSGETNEEPSLTPSTRRAAEIAIAKAEADQVTSIAYWSSTLHRQCI